MTDPRNGEILKINVDSISYIRNNGVLMRGMGLRKSGRNGWVPAVGVALVLQLALIAVLAAVGIWVPSAVEESETVVDLSIAVEVPPVVERTLEFGSESGVMQPPDFGSFDRMRATDWFERTTVESQSVSSDWELVTVPVDGLEALLADRFGEGFGAMDFGSDLSFSFLGVNEAAERVVIAFDISLSVVNDMRSVGQSIERVRDETDRLISELSALVEFGLVQFARNHCWFREELLPATAGVREQARQWLRREFRTDGRAGPDWRRGQPYNGIQAVLAEVFAYQPEVVFIVSNGRFFRSPGNEQVPWDELAADLRRLQRQLPTPARIHFIGYGVRDDVRPHLREWLRPWRGKLIEHGRDRKADLPGADQL